MILNEFEILGLYIMHIRRILFIMLLNNLNQNFNHDRYNLLALNKTMRLLITMAKAAKRGVSMPKAARAIPKQL